METICPYCTLSTLITIPNIDSILSDLRARLINKLQYIQSVISKLTMFLQGYIMYIGMQE
jgi:hypothetical protein